jgi:hypothetical protein
MRWINLLCPIEDPDNLLISDIMVRTWGAGLLGADVQALIHWCDPTRLLGAEIPPWKKGGMADEMALHIHTWLYISSYSRIILRILDVINLGNDEWNFLLIS